MKTIMLDRPREIKLTLNAMIKFEEATGIDLENPEKTDSLGIKDLKQLIFLSITYDESLKGKLKRLVGLDRKLSFDRVGDYVHTGNLQEITKVIVESKEEIESKKN